MRAASLALVILAAWFDRSLAFSSPRASAGVTCSDIKRNAAGWLANRFSSDATRVFEVAFYLATNRRNQSVRIDLDDWSQLESSEFDPSKRTFVIAHGYLSGGQKPWVLELKDAILDSRDGNVIMVDWSDGGNKKNYVNAAKNTILASNRILNFLQTLRVRARDLRGSSSQTLYNHLHLIGHSLGAHVCGQTAHLLRDDNFWVIDRVTGLDPAKPCFGDVDASLRIDKNSAAFVDVYHTQIGRGLFDALGMSDALGHVDFYLNGGVVQPECRGDAFGYQEMICSHRLATKYFIESIRDEKRRDGGCSFPIQRWNGSYADAQMRIGFLRKGLSCRNCPRMGMDAVDSALRGVFLVLTGSTPPYCGFEPDRDLQRIIPGIMRLKGVRSIFDNRKPDEGVLIL